MLSHQRKRLEVEVAENIRRKLTPNMEQYGFQRNLGPLNALVDTKSLIERERPWLEILHLKRHTTE